MANNQTASSPSENGRDGDKPKDSVNMEKTTEWHGMYSYNKDGDGRYLRGGRQRYVEQRYSGAEYRGDGVSRMDNRWDVGRKTAFGDYGRGRGNGWDRGKYDEDRWEGVNSRQPGFGTWDVNKRYIDNSRGHPPRDRDVGRRAGHYDNRWMQGEQRREYLETRRFSRREQFSGGRWNGNDKRFRAEERWDYMEKGRDVPYEKSPSEQEGAKELVSTPSQRNEESSEQRVFTSPAKGRNESKQESDSTYSTVGMTPSGRDHSMKRNTFSKAWNKEFSECTTHPSASPSPSSHIKAVESLLLGDLADVIVIDPPTSSILPILLFFEEELKSSTKAPVVSNKIQVGMNVDLLGSQDVKDLLNKAPVEKMVDEAIGVGNPDEADVKPTKREKTKRTGKKANEKENVFKARDGNDERVAELKKDDVLEKIEEKIKVTGQKRKTEEISDGKRGKGRKKKNLEMEGEDGGRIKKRSSKKDIKMKYERLEEYEEIDDEGNGMAKIERNLEVMEVGESTGLFQNVDVYSIDEKNIPEDFNDERYKYFLKRTLPMVYKAPDLAAKYIIDQRSMLLERANNNRADVPSLVDMPSEAPKNVIPEIPAIPSCEWSEEEEKTFESSVLRCGNDFRKLKEYIPGISTASCILKYYLMKNKTFSYIKRRPGRMSDSEIKLIVENEWSSYEINIFMQHFRIFGKNWSKYQALISKTEKDLKIFFRYYTKFVVPSKKKVPAATPSHPIKRNSISRSEILEKWTIDERQIFAIYFPYYNKNWISMATYFPMKTASDLRQYYNRYYKTLSYNEQRFEASLYNFGKYFSTPPASHIGNSREEAAFCFEAGVLFKK